MSAHRALADNYFGPSEHLDPGNAGTIYSNKDPVQTPLTSTGAETRTLARPTRTGQIMTLHARTVGGNITVTVTGGYNQNGDTTLVFSAVGQYAVFESFATTAGVFFWQMIANYGGTMADPLGTQLAASAAEINRIAKLSTRMVTVGTAISITAAAHEGRDILLSGTGSSLARTLPAATGTGARYRFWIAQTNTSNHIIQAASSSDLFNGGINVWITSSTQTAFAPNGSSNYIITLNGTTTGGIAISGPIDFLDQATNAWYVTGSTRGSGSVATPFSG